MVVTVPARMTDKRSRREIQEQQLLRLSEGMLRWLIILYNYCTIPYTVYEYTMYNLPLDSLKTLFQYQIVLNKFKYR